MEDVRRPSINIASIVPQPDSSVIAAPMDYGNSADPGIGVLKGMPRVRTSIPAQARPVSRTSTPKLRIGRARIDSRNETRCSSSAGIADTSKTRSAATARPRRAPGRRPSTPLAHPSGVPAPSALSGARSRRAAKPMTARLTTPTMTRPAPFASSIGIPRSRSGSPTDLTR